MAYRSPYGRTVTTNDGKVIYDKTATLSPVDVLKDEVAVDAPDTALELSVYDASGRRMLSYRAAEKKIEEIPDPARPAKDPRDIMTAEELYLTGQHIEQYRHATYLPDGYYEEALRRDPGDIRSNNAYGMLLLRRGRFGEAEAKFRAAIARMTERNPNPYSGEAYMNLGLALLISYGEKHFYDQVKIDYFAVSLPDLQLFESDLTVSNRAHCEYLIALGSYGLGDMARAKQCFDAVLAIDNEHQGAMLHRRLIEETEVR